jgi:hypothetical protein
MNVEGRIEKNGVRVIGRGVCSERWTRRHVGKQMSMDDAVATVRGQVHVLGRQDRQSGNRARSNQTDELLAAAVLSLCAAATADWPSANSRHSPGV